MKYVKGFDTLRAFALIFVLICHWGPFFTPGMVANQIMTRVLPSGMFCVVLFFVLSGYLITTILLKERYKAIEEGGKLSTVIKSFYIRRSLRIFPIYYLTLLVLLFIGDPYLRSHAGYYFLYMGNLPPYHVNQVNPLIHMWTLAVEEQFYLMWPFLMLFLSEKYLKPVFVTGILVGIVSKYVVTYIYGHDFATLMLNWADAFGLGGLYAYLRVNKKHKAFDKAFVAVVILTLYVAVRKAPIEGLPIFNIYKREVDAIISLGMVIFVLNNKSEWVRKYLLENRLLNAMGRISYGVYLYHYVIDGYVDDLVSRVLSHYPHSPAYAHSFWVYYVAKLAAVFTLATLSYKYLELPLLGLKKYFKYSMTEESAMKKETSFKYTIHCGPPGVDLVVKPAGFDGGIGGQ